MHTIIPDLLLLALLLILIGVPSLDAVYRKGRRDGHRAAVATESPAPEPIQPPAVLEVIEVFQSENVLWRYGTGHTVLTGYCPGAAYPAQALEKVQTYLNEQRHAAAADELLDDFLDTHGVFKNLE